MVSPACPLLRFTWCVFYKTSLLVFFEVSKLQLNFTSSSSSQGVQPSIGGPGTSATLKVISLVLRFGGCAVDRFQGS